MQEQLKAPPHPKPSFELQVFNPDKGVYEWRMSGFRPGELAVFARGQFKAWRVVRTDKRRALKPSTRHVGYGSGPFYLSLAKKRPSKARPRWIGTKGAALARIAADPDMQL